MFVISLALAHRLLPCVSTEETRFYLNGVGVDFCKNGGACLVATDGHVLGLYRDHEAHGTFAGEGLPIISRQAIADAFKAARKEAKRFEPSWYWLIVDEDGAGRVMLAKTAADAMHGRNEKGEPCETLWRSLKSILVDGTYPDYRRVIPSEAHAVAPSDYGWNPALLGRFASVIAPDDKGAARFISLISGSPDGNGPWFVLSAAVPDFVGVAMPARNGGATPATLVAAARDTLDLEAARLQIVDTRKAKDRATA